MYAFADAIQQAKDSFTYSSDKDRIGRLAKTAVLRAYHDLSYKSAWNYLRRQTQINLLDPYNAGSVSYSAATRIMTLAGGTWPSNATQGLILMNRNIYAVQQVLSGTQLLLQVNRSPAQDFLSGTVYNLVYTSYPLPADFLELRGITEIERLWNVCYMSPEDMLQRSQMWFQPSQSLFYTIIGGTGGRMNIQFQPPPAQARTFDIVYQAKPRMPTLFPLEFSSGSVTVTAGSTVVTSANTLPLNLKPGCLFRIGSDAVPTGNYGDNPPVEEHLVASVTDATHFQTVDLIVNNASAVKFTLGDPVDLELTSMLTYFFRKMELELITLHQSDTKVIQAATERAFGAMIEAKEADSRMNPAAIANSQIVTGWGEAVLGLVGQQAGG